MKIGNVTEVIEVHVVRGMKTQPQLGLDSASYFKLSLDLSTLTLTQQDTSTTCNPKPLNQHQRMNDNMRTPYTQ